MKKLAIVTVNYNTAKDTNLLLESIEKLANKNFSTLTIIVDNGSDETYILPRDKKQESITLIRSEKNTGFSGGFNLGIKEALKKASDYILIVNNDTTMDPKIAEILLSVLESKPEIGVTTPKIYFTK